MYNQTWIIDKKKRNFSSDRVNSFTLNPKFCILQQIETWLYKYKYND